MIAYPRQRMNKQGIACFRNVQILDLANTGVEIFVEEDHAFVLHLGKNAEGVIQKNPVRAEWLETKTDHNRKGNYFYWYTIPLMNYYHLLLDGVGCLTRYFALKKEIPDLKLMLNKSPRPKGGVKKHPPFVTELLELLEIDYEFTDDTARYQTVYFGDTQGQEPKGGRCRPREPQYILLQECIERAKIRVSVPQYDKIYLSRRAHANPLNDRKNIIGEDNTVKRGLTNEDEVVDILTRLGYTEVFGENYTLPEKIVLFNGMQKYISTAGAGVANILWTMPNHCSVGGIHTPGFPFPNPDHKKHICCHPEFIKATINNYSGAVLFKDKSANPKNYNRPWYIDNLSAFENWAKTI